VDDAKIIKWHLQLSLDSVGKHSRWDGSLYHCT